MYKLFFYFILKCINVFFRNRKINSCGIVGYILITTKILPFPSFIIPSYKQTEKNNEKFYRELEQNRLKREQSQREHDFRHSIKMSYVRNGY